MDELGNLRAYVRTVESASVSRAAEQLNIAKSAVSRRIRELERSLGSALLIRAGRSIRPTDVGQEFYERAVRILADLEEAQASARDSHAALAGLIRLTAPASFGTLHLPGPIREFRNRHPQIRFEIDMDDKRVDLMAGNVDLALRIGRLSDSDLISRQLTRIRHAVAASPAFWDKHGRPETPEDLSTLPALDYMGRPDAKAWSYKRPDGAVHAVRMAPQIRAGNGDFLCQLAASGMGVIMEPTFILHRFVASGALEPVLLDYNWSNTHLHALYMPTRHLSRRVRAFIDFLGETFSGTPAWDRGIFPEEPVGPAN